MFYALAHHKVDTEGLTFEHVLADIETLNREAMAGTYELTAMSYHAYAWVADKYAILTVGSSVGNQYGPILVARDAMTQADLQTDAKKRIAIPGKLTSAYLALKIWEPHIDADGAQTVVVPFDQILERVQAGEFDAGLIIHEGQLTFGDHGLHRVVDLGVWWYEECNLPLPLGANGIRKNLGPQRMQAIGRVMHRTVAYGLAHRDAGLDYAAQFARGISRERMDRFVSMYVNEMTMEADMKLRRAIKLLLWRGFGVGLIPTKIEPEFITPVFAEDAAAEMPVGGCCHGH
jgi:1,4-dihydroxy-6-naphthoate synthase